MQKLFYFHTKWSLLVGKDLPDKATNSCSVNVERCNSGSEKTKVRVVKENFTPVVFALTTTN